MTLPWLLPSLLVAMAVLAGLFLFVRHQRRVRTRAWLMREAVRNRDFSFRLRPTGMFPGEKALLQSLNDISGEMGRVMARDEAESWQRLMRVLTHEIMNSATPICSISHSFMDDPALRGTIYEEGMRSIYETGTGLAAFVENFRKVTSIQQPVMAEVALRALVRSVQALYPDVAWHVALPDGLCLMADEQMLRQVLINLVRNALEAGARDVDVRWNDALYVSNNGARIPDDVARDIFIPFFTTKRNGSGIGLALSRQMLFKQDMYLLLADIPVSGYHVTFCICPQSTPSSL